MAWQELHFQCDKDNAELAESLLLENDALSITFVDAGDQPLFEPMPGQSPLWDEIIITGLFPVTHLDDANDTNEIKRLDELSLHIASQINATRAWITPLADTDWERVWMSHYHPIECANHLWIVPKWLEPPVSDAVNIIMDPGLAFGTGYHATTRLCLDWLTEQNLNGNLAGKTVIDYGCGSGILGIGALLLGAKQVFAVDIDPQAVLATKQNAERNGVADRLQAFLPDDFQQAFEKNPNVILCDMMIANILAKPLMTLAPYFATLCKPNAQIVLSGLIAEQLDDVRHAYAPYFYLTDDFAFAKTEDAHWHRLSGVFKD